VVSKWAGKQSKRKNKMEIIMLFLILAALVAAPAAAKHSITKRLHLGFQKKMQLPSRLAEVGHQALAGHQGDS
jgi:hypothetical protein